MQEIYENPKVYVVWGGCEYPQDDEKYIECICSTQEKANEVVKMLRKSRNNEKDYEYEEFKLDVMVYD